jgi:hypothetical protein
MTTGQHPDFAAISWEDLANAVAMCATAQWDPINHPAWKETLERFVALNDAGPGGHGQAAPAAPMEPPLPPGEYATVHIMGHLHETGWVTEGTRAGVPVLVIRDWEGRVKREVPGHALYQYVPHPTPLRRPDPEPLAALPAGQGDPWADERYDGREDDGEPADGFAAQVDPEAAF